MNKTHPQRPRIQTECNPVWCNTNGTLKHMGIMAIFDDTEMHELFYRHNCPFSFVPCLFFLEGEKKNIKGYQNVII